MRNDRICRWVCVVVHRDCLNNCIRSFSGHNCADDEIQDNGQNREQGHHEPLADMR